MTYEVFADQCMHILYEELGGLSEETLDMILREDASRLLLKYAPPRDFPGGLFPAGAGIRPFSAGHLQSGQVLTEKLCEELLSPEDLSLFRKLRDLRRMISLETGLPPYTVFTNRALMDMYVKRPLTNEQFLEVYGVGPVNSGRHGAPFLELIRKETLLSEETADAADTAAEETEV